MHLGLTRLVHVLRACARTHVHETDAQRRKVTLLASHVSSRADKSDEYCVIKRPGKSREISDVKTSLSTVITLFYALSFLILSWKVDSRWIDAIDERILIDARSWFVRLLESEQAINFDPNSFHILISLSLSLFFGLSR